jgi:hypothetical protein
MQLVAVAAWAILLPLHPLWVKALVLRREVIAILTIAASQNDFVAGHIKPLSPKAKRQVPKAAVAFGAWPLAFGRLFI